MKESKKIAIIITIVVITIISITGAIIGGIIILTNQTKKAITLEEFEAKVKEKGYMVISAKDQFEDYEYIETAKLAVSNDYSHKIEFYELTNENYASNFFENNKRNFEKVKTTASIETNIQGKNYATYILKANGKYMLVSRIENTVIYVHVQDTAEQKVKEVIKELGY